MIEVAEGWRPETHERNTIVNYHWWQAKNPIHHCSLPALVFVNTGRKPTDLATGIALMSVTGHRQAQFEQINIWRRYMARNAD